MSDSRCLGMHNCFRLATGGGVANSSFVKLAATKLNLKKVEKEYYRTPTSTPKSPAYYRLAAAH